MIVRICIMTIVILISACSTQKTFREVVEYDLLVYDPPVLAFPLCGLTQKCFEAVFVAEHTWLLGKERIEYSSAGCCWRCESGSNTCNRNVWPGKVIRDTTVKFPDFGRCDKTTTEHFSGSSLQAFDAYLDSLVRLYGKEAGLDETDVRIHITDADPPMVGGKVTAGECGGEFTGVAETTAGAKFYVTLYYKAFNNKCLSKVYNTIAHEFQHILQVRKHNLSCSLIRDNISQYEQEAKQWADRMIPICSDC